MMTQKKHNWLLYAIITMVTWGLWGAFSDQTTLPKTMVYVIWALSMVPCALAALINIRFKLDVRRKPALLSMAVGLLGAGGQLVLFLALDYAPAYLVMPMISVAPIVTVLLSTVFLKERVSKLGILGIVLAFVALVCFALPDNTDGAVKSWVWILYASVVFISWGIQAFVMKLANNSTPDAESVFVYMAAAAVLLIPIALWMGDGTCMTDQGWGELTDLHDIEQREHSRGAERKHVRNDELDEVRSRHATARQLSGAVFPEEGCRQAQDAHHESRCHRQRRLRADAVHSDLARSHHELPRQKGAKHERGG